MKARELGLPLGQDGARVYGAVQRMFNAKTDLALVLPNCLIVFEAKFTQKFHDVQLRRTGNIADVWATLLHRDLGFVARLRSRSQSSATSTTACTCPGRTA
jgi:hypothetical protein